MFSIKYNIINLVKVLLSILNMVLMLRLFSLSQESDLYLLAYSIVYAFNFVPLLLMGQFMQFYNDLKTKSVQAAHDFYNQSVLFSALIGILLFGLAFVFLNLLLQAHTLHLDAPRFMVLTRIMKVMVFAILFLPLAGLLERFFLAERKFFMLYCCQIIQILGPVLALGYMLIVRRADVLVLTGAYTISVAVSVLLGLGVVAVQDIALRFALPKHFKAFVKNSFSTHLGVTITNFFMPVILNNFLVYFPNGVISCFYYSRNALTATDMIATDYSNKLIASEISAGISNHNFTAVARVVKKYLLFVPACFGGVAVALYACIPWGLKIVFMKTNFIIDTALFQTLFLGLIPSFILGLIAIPYYSINIANKNSAAAIWANVGFVIVLGGLLYLAPTTVYAIAWALAGAQGIYALVCYIFYAVWRKKCSRKSA